MKYSTGFGIGLSVLLMWGCGESPETRNPNIIENTKPVQASVDEVKLIASEIKDPRDARTFSSSQYQISSQSRLLIRFSGLKEKSEEILDEQAVLVRLQVETGSEAWGQGLRPRLCPLTANWMLLATWKKAHPYRGGDWAREGGDFDEASCLTVLDRSEAVLQPDQEKAFCAVPAVSAGSAPAEVLCFDLKPYLQQFVRSRGIDYGFAVVWENETPLLVRGEKGLKGPELFWRRFR